MIGDWIGDDFFLEGLGECSGIDMMNLVRLK